MNCIAMRVAIVSAIMNGFAGMRTSVPVYNILDYGSSALVFERSLAAFAIYLCVGLRQGLTDARTCPVCG